MHYLYKVHNIIDIRLTLLSRQPEQHTALVHTSAERWAAVDMINVEKHQIKFHIETNKRASDQIKKRGKK